MTQLLKKSGIMVTERHSLWFVISLVQTTIIAIKISASQMDRMKPAIWVFKC